MLRMRKREQGTVGSEIGQEPQVLHMDAGGVGESECPQRLTTTPTSDHRKRLLVNATLFAQTTPLTQSVWPTIDPEPTAQHCKNHRTPPTLLDSHHVSHLRVTLLSLTWRRSICQVTPSAEPCSSHVRGWLSPPLLSPR